MIQIIYSHKLVNINFLINKSNKRFSFNIHNGVRLCNQKVYYKYNLRNIKWIEIY